VSRLTRRRLFYWHRRELHFLEEEVCFKTLPGDGDLSLLLQACMMHVNGLVLLPL
jgi:hypothetical protein